MSYEMLRALFCRQAASDACVFRVVRQEKKGGRKEQTNDDEAAVDHTSRHAVWIGCRLNIYRLFMLDFIACIGAAWLRGRGGGHIRVSELNIKCR